MLRTKAEIIMAERTLATWLYEEIEKRHESIRGFATKAKIAHTTLNRILNPTSETEEYPSLDTLIKLADFTKVDVCTLVAMVAPDVTDIDPDVRLIAQRIARLPAAQQEVIDTYLLGLSLKPD